MLRGFINVLLCTLFTHSVFGQENIIFSNDHYSGVNSVVISPAMPFLNPNPWDINIIAADVFLQNSYLYISNQSVIGLRNAEIETANIRQNIRGENTPNVMDFFRKDLVSYHFSSEILGPSVSFKTSVKDKKFSVGLFSRLRTQSSALGIDNYLRFANQGVNEPDQYFLKPFEVNFMNWGELGLNLSTEIFPYSEYQWILGGNFKYEIGLDAARVSSKSRAELVRSESVVNGVTEESITISDYDIETSFATNFNFDNDRYEVKQKGKGLGLDFGISVVEYFEGSEDYNFRASLNIIDIGSVNFSRENHVFKGATIAVVNNSNLENTRLDSPQKLMKILSQEVYNDENTSFRGTDFTVGLPTSMHLNFSKNVGINRYVNANWIQRVPIMKNSLKRNNIFNVSYLVHKPAFGYGVSTSLQEYRNLQFGGYLRIGPLILGSENLFPLIFKHKKLHAADFYIALKLYPFWDNELKRHRRADCYCD